MYVLASSTFFWVIRSKHDTSATAATISVSTSMNKEIKPKKLPM